MVHFVPLAEPDLLPDAEPGLLPAAEPGLLSTADLPDLTEDGAEATEAFDAGGLREARFWELLGMPRKAGGFDLGRGGIPDFEVEDVEGTATVLSSLS